MFQFHYIENDKGYVFAKMCIFLYLICSLYFDVFLLTALSSLIIIRMLCINLLYDIYILAQSIWHL